MPDYTPDHHAEELLRRCLLRVTLAARGRSPELDRSLDTRKQAVVDRSDLEAALEELSSTLLRMDAPPEPAASTPPAPDHSWLERLAGRLGTSREQMNDSGLGEALRVQLQAILGALTLPETLHARHAVLRQAADQPMRPDQLPPLLKATADLIREAASLESTRLELFLSEVADQLDHIHRFLHSHDRNNRQDDEECRELNANISNRVEAIRASMEDASDPWALRSVIGEQLSGIIQHLDYYERCRSSRQETLDAAMEDLNRQLASSETELENLRRNLALEQRLAELDPLTELPNRQAYDRRLQKEIEHSRREGVPLSLLVGDVDGFKGINDRFGHQTGDRVLRSVASVLQANVRQTDLLARYGGEEFVVILPGADRALASQLGERLRSAMASQPFHAGEKRVPVTISFGVAVFRETDTPETLFARGDEAMYRAKNLGRNRVVPEQGKKH
ncbi:MAG: diguanylate cyclase [Ectothiorhodospiraceae bacterium]|nr:diguanylate cyclase [Ectothiorhodospiraceae bacterium]